MGRTFNREGSVASTASGKQFGVPWRRSVSRDLATDIESVFNANRTPTEVATLPRGGRYLFFRITNHEDLPVVVIMIVLLHLY